MQLDPVVYHRFSVMTLIQKWHLSATSRDSGTLFVSGTSSRFALRFGSSLAALWQKADRIQLS